MMVAEHNLQRRIIPFLIRVASTGIRFTFIIWVSKYFDAPDAGMLLLSISFVDFFTYLSGLDFYTHANKEFIRSPSKRFSINSSHLLFLLGAGCAQALILAVFGRNFFAAYSHVFIGICIGELLATEFYRRLISVGKVSTGSWFLLLKQGVWPSLIIATSYFGHVSLETVLGSWAVTMLALVSAVTFIWRKNLMRSVVLISFSSAQIQWIKAGVLASLGMYISALATRGMLYVDKQYIAIVAPEVLAAYGLYFSVAMVVITAVESFTVPHMIHSYLKSQSTNELFATTKKFLKECFLISGGVFVGLSTLMSKILGFIDKSEYYNYHLLLYPLLGASIARAMSIPMQYFFYSIDKTFVVGAASLVPILLFSLTLATFHPSNIYQISACYLFAWTSMFLAYLVVYLLEVKRDCRPGKVDWR